MGNKIIKKVYKNKRNHNRKGFKSMSPNQSIDQLTNTLHYFDRKSMMLKRKKKNVGTLLNFNLNIFKKNSRNVQMKQENRQKRFVKIILISIDP